MSGTLADPNATAATVALAAKLLAAPGEGIVYSGAWFVGYFQTDVYVSGGPSFGYDDFVQDFEDFYGESGGQEGTGWPFVMGVYDGGGDSATGWTTYIPNLAVPHVKAGGAFAWLPMMIGPIMPHYAPGQNGPMGNYGTDGTWRQGVGQASGPFTVDSTFNPAVAEGVVPCATGYTSPTNDLAPFPYSGTIMVGNGSALIQYQSLGPTGFYGCSCTNYGPSPGVGTAYGSGTTLTDSTLLIPGTAQNAALNGFLDNVAAGLTYAAAENAPVILRLLWEPSDNPQTNDYWEWHCQTETEFYATAWVYMVNYLLGNAAQTPVSGCNGVLTTETQPVVPTTTGEYPTAPVHNALFAFTNIGTGTPLAGTNPPPGYVDIIGHDVYTDTPATVSVPLSTWANSQTRYGTGIITGYAEMGSLANKVEDCRGYRNLLQAQSNGGTPCGPSFFMGWTNDYNRDRSLASQDNFAEFWNNTPGGQAIGQYVSNLYPGAWPMSPARAGAMI